MRHAARSVLIVLAVATAGCAAGTASGRPSPSAPAARTSAAPRTTVPTPTPATITPARTTPARTTPARTTPARPRRTPAPGLVDRRIVAYYGAGNSPGLGVLGQGEPEAVWQKLARQAAAYAAPGRPVQPAFELIATVAQAAPGDGTYRYREPASTIARYLAVVRRHHGLLVLDVQPGRADFPSEVRALRPWLAQPDVSLALDPEWRMAPGEVPGRTIGEVSATEVNAVSAWLEALIARHHLPRKLFLIHRFTYSMITNAPALAARPHLREVVNVDGFGSRPAKLARYRAFSTDARFGIGLKLFYRQDIGLLSPAQVLGLRPAPAVIDYQ